MAGRGLDFEHRFNTSRWAEDLLLKSLNDAPGFLAVRFGISQIRTAKDVTYDKTAWKEPDLLVFTTASLTKSERLSLAGRDLSVENRESFKRGGELHFAVAKAAAAIEVEFSPYQASEMKGRAWTPKTEDQWKRRPLIHAKPPVAPNIWVKEEDLSRLIGWESELRVPIIVAHLFDQEGFAVRLGAVNAFNDRFETPDTDPLRLQMTSGIFKMEQSYDRQDAQGAREKKTVFVVTPAVATKIGEVKDVKVEAQIGLSASKKYVAHVLFTGGRITFSPDFLSMLTSARQ